MHTASTPGDRVKEGLTRRIIRTASLMSAVIEFSGGPWPQPDPLHSHPHEQISFVAEGEILFFAAGNAPERLTSGDLFAVPSGVPHAVQLLSPTARLIDTFTPIREDFIA